MEYRTEMAEHGRSGGPKPKDAVITGGFNRNKKGLSKAEMAKAKREAAAAEMVERERRSKAEGELERLSERAAQLRSKLGMDAMPEDLVGDAGTAAPPPVDDDTSSAEMIRDLRWAYKQGIGKTKLKEMIKDEKLGLPLIKELVKIEVAYLQAKLREKERYSESGQAVFVVIKGLDKPPVEVEDGAADLRQIQHVLNPDGTEYEG